MEERIWNILNQVVVFLSECGGKALSESIWKAFWAFDPLCAAAAEVPQLAGVMTWLNYNPWHIPANLYVS